jgi:hypothetical protein
MDPATKRLGLLATVLGSLLLVLIGVWTITGRHGGGVPLIAPPGGPMRVKPASPGGMQLSANEDLFSPSHGAVGAGKLAPPPETPDPQALTQPPTPPKPDSAPATVPAPVEANPPSPTPASPPVVASKPVAPAVTAKPPARTETAPATGHVAVQLAALPTEQAAKDQWALLQHRMPDLLHGRSLTISKTDLSGHTWWRLRTGGFADPNEAKGFCDKVRAKSEACDVLKP